MRNPFKYFKTSPEIIRLAVIMYIRFPLSLRNVEDVLHERGVDITHETVRFWWNRFEPLFAKSIRKRRVGNQRYSNWTWHLDGVLVKIGGELHYLWRAVDHEGEVLEVYGTQARGPHGSAQVFAQNDEAIRQSTSGRDRSGRVLQSRDESARQCRPRGDRALAQ